VAAPLRLSERNFKARTLHRRTKNAAPSEATAEAENLENNSRFLVAEKTKLARDDNVLNWRAGPSQKQALPSFVRAGRAFRSSG
jgi:hypothetical protein